jgi:hypothetical protein
MGSRAHGSAVPNTSGSADPPTRSTPAAAPMQSPITSTNRTAPGPAITPAGPEQPAVLPQSHGSRLPPVHIRPELADLRSQGHSGSIMGDHAESAIWPPQYWLKRSAAHILRDCRTTNDHADPRISMYKCKVLNSALCMQASAAAPIVSRSGLGAHYPATPWSRRRPIQLRPMVASAQANWAYLAVVATSAGQTGRWRPRRASISASSAA